MEEEDALTTPVVPWVAVILTLVVGLAWARPLSSPQLAGLPLTGPLLAYLVAELAAPALVGFGRFPLSAAALLVTIGCSEMGRAPWLFLVVVGVVVRGLRCAVRREPMLSVLGDGLPEFWAGLAAWTAPAPWSVPAAAFVYLLGWQLLPGLFASSVATNLLHLWSMARERSLATLTFLLILGGALAGMVVPQTFSVLLSLAAVPLLAVPVSAQFRVLQAESKARDQDRLGRAQERTSYALAELQTQVDLQRVDVELQHRVLTLVGELFMETALIQSPADLRPALLSFIRRAIPGARITLFESDGAGLNPSAGYGPDEYQPAGEVLEELSADRVRSVQIRARTCSHLAAHIPQRGLLVVSDPEPRWQPEHSHLLYRLAYHLPLCLDAVRYREMHSRALEDEQTRRQELDRLAARLTACLDLLGQLVSCRTTDELVRTAQNRLPDLIPGYRAEVLWREQLFSSGALATDPANYQFPLYAGQVGEGQLRLYSRGGKSLSVLDTELLNLFSIQFACLLEGAELNERLRQALEKVKTSQAQVVQSSKMAAIGQLAAGVAHELNTPLGAVSIAIELSIETLRDNPERASKRLTKAMESVEQMQGIIAKLLFYSRDSRGVRSRVDLYKVMDDSCQLVSHTLKMSGVEVELSQGPSILIEANSNELQQVFSNLLINAKDACCAAGASQKRIEMWLEQKGQQAQVHVKDHGCGMDEETRHRIFEPFFTTKAIGEGTGLGLSTSLELVQQHGGTLHCQSEPGQGTHFLVSLPLSTPA
jgi:signal transduction histidine kinase